MDVGEGREHDYREVGGRMKWEPESRSGSFEHALEPLCLYAPRVQVMGMYAGFAGAKTGHGRMAVVYDRPPRVKCPNMFRVHIALKSA